MTKGLPAWAQASVPEDCHLLSREQLEDKLAHIQSAPISLVAVGDVMLAKRAKRPIATQGRDYPFRSVSPLLKDSPIVLANHEGPIAKKARLEQRHYSYRVDPGVASVLVDGGINVVTLANNHLMDCGLGGVLETVEAADRAGLRRIGIGRDLSEARSPLILQAGEWRVGLLGYYWNKRCAATSQRPGAATGTETELQEDVAGLRGLVDWVVVTFHWGIPYEGHPLDEDRAKAHHAIECGADLVIGHHPHVVQPYEVYGNRLIFYSLGNFAFGSGNSHAAGLLVRVSFSASGMMCQLFPLYVKNRDPRVHYQTRVLTGSAAERMLGHLSDVSNALAPPLDIRSGVGYLHVPMPAEKLAKAN